VGGFTSTTGVGCSTSTTGVGCSTSPAAAPAYVPPVLNWPWTLPDFVVIDDE
jgi:hypothetical protein